MGSDSSEAKFGRYAIVEALAKGGMAQIYKAKTPQGKIFTLKKILKDYSDNADFIQMFLEEAKISLQLKHPHVIRVLDFGQIDSTYFLAMEYVFGRDVSALLKKCAENRMYIPMDVACHMIYQCCLGLDYAHHLKDSFGNPLSIVHRDISPPNILVSYNGEAKILDFGIAKALTATTRENTRSGVLKGKFSYMSPEQASGKPIDMQSDVFSLGTVLYELLTTRNLFYTPDEIETLEKVRKADVQPPSKVRKDIPPELDKIVLKALAQKTKARYKTCAEFGDALQSFLTKYFPRSDHRSVAKFVRSVFSHDFQTRLQKSLQEGWRDVLQVGSSDEELMLDQSESQSASRSSSMRIRKADPAWWDRLLYDPKVKREFKRKLIQGGTALFALGFCLFVYVGIQSGRFERWFSEHEEHLPAEAKNELNASPAPPAVGSFVYWIQEAEKYVKTEDYLSALRAYERAQEINPFDVNLQIKRQFINLNLGHIQESCAWFLNKAKELPPTEASLSSAICSEALGDNQNALMGYSDFVLRFPEDSRVNQVKSIITSLKGKLAR